MYLVSAYFDEQSNRTLQGYINKIAEYSGNSFMIDNTVPPHLTISSIEARSVDELRDAFISAINKLSPGEIIIPTLGQLFPYVVYGGVVLNDYLQNMQKIIYDEISVIPGISVNRYYMPNSWIPHVTLAKTLKNEQMRIAFEIMQKTFNPVRGKVVEIGLAQTNPHEDILRMKL